MTRLPKTHPIADVFPMFASTELDELTEDIRAHGQRDPVLMWRGLLVDGRNRWLACEAAEVVPLSAELVCSELEMIDEVLSRNLRRRSLTTPQKAQAVVDGGALRAATEEARVRQREEARAHGIKGAEHGVKGAEHGVKGGRPLKDGDKRPLRDNAIPKGAFPAPSATKPPRKQDESARARAVAARRAGVSERAIRAAQTVAAAAPEAAQAVREAIHRGEVRTSAEQVRLTKLPAAIRDRALELQRTGQQRGLTMAIGAAEREARQVQMAARAKSSAPRSDAVQILTGDAVELLASMPEGSAQLCVMDPPYGLDVHRTRHGQKDYEDGKDYALDLLRRTCRELLRVLDSDAHVYVFSGYTHVAEFASIMREVFGDEAVQGNPIIWDKGTHNMCDFQRWYASSYEFILFARRSRSRTFPSKIARDIIHCKREPARDGVHSAAKPVDLLSYLIRQSSDEGETVIDPFVGSGSTCLAARDLGRRAIGVELDPKMADVARGRLA